MLFCVITSKKTQINMSIAAALCRQHPLTTLGVHHTEARVLFWKVVIISVYEDV